MSRPKIENQTIALSAIYQSCYLVKQIAWGNEYKKSDFNVLINSLFKMNTNTIDEIYKNINFLNTGMNLLKNKLVGEKFSQETEINDYFNSLIILSNLVKKNIPLISKIKEYLKKIESECLSDNLELDDKVTKLSQIYQNTLSTINPRIIVSGDNKFLQIQLNKCMIRTALFTGLRSVFLWQQHDGSKIKNFFYKPFILKSLNQILKNN